jgi:hypothetical protein
MSLRSRAKHLLSRTRSVMPRVTRSASAPARLASVVTRYLGLGVIREPVKAGAEGMSRALSYLERVLLELLNNSEYGLTPLRAAQALWGNHATEANKQAIRWALSVLEGRGLIQRDLGSRRYYANSGRK